MIFAVVCDYGKNGNRILCLIYKVKNYQNLRIILRNEFLFPLPPLDSSHFSSVALLLFLSFDFSWNLYATSFCRIYPGLNVFSLYIEEYEENGMRYGICFKISQWGEVMMGI